MKPFAMLAVCGAVLAASRVLMAETPLETVLARTQPLTRPLGKRLGLYVWAAMDVPGTDEQIARTLQALHARGIAACATWRPGKHLKASLAGALRMAAVQKRLGLRVNINANACTYSVFDGSPATAHVDAGGKPFFDTSSGGAKLGCPFTLRPRYAAMAEQVEPFVRAYKAKGLPIDLVFADWEIDGPIEWNEGWAAARRCTRCRKHVPDIDHFAACQKAFRRARCEATRACYAQPVLRHFPKALVGNYGVYPNDGWRYWYDYFEKVPPPKPVGARVEGRGVYRPWPRDEFKRSGYTFAMPVLYTRHDIWTWYDWPSDDFRWFHALLLQAGSVGKHTPAGVPIISFVNYTSCCKRSGKLDPVKPMSAAAYRELLWHALLRGHDAFFLWCPAGDVAAEIVPLHAVFAESLAHAEFLNKGTPVSFDVPTAPGPVVSGLKLGDRVLVRRTDFTDTTDPVVLRVGKARLKVPRLDGKVRIFTLGK